MVKIEEFNTNVRAAIQLIDTLNRYLHNVPFDENEKILFQEIPIRKFALEASIVNAETALHKLLYELAYNDFYIMSYDDLIFEDEFLHETINFLQFIFSEMRIEFPDDFTSTDAEVLEETRRNHENAFLDGLDNIVVDAFSILWNQRSVLRKFNEILANEIRNTQETEQKILNEKGRISRLNYWPSWLITVLNIRDGGICPNCGRPHTPFLGSIIKNHIDHVIPLANGGGNDATNLQLLCSDCNLKKGKKDEIISDKFYWPEYKKRDRLDLTIYKPNLAAMKAY